MVRAADANETDSADLLPGGLIRTTDREPGIRRRRCGRGFSYLTDDGGRVRDAAEIARIRSLVIPPAYRDVWICRFPDGHLQATGCDDAGRKQYRYHPDFTAFRQRMKFDEIIRFAEALPRLRKRVQRDLHRARGARELHRDFAAATAARLLDLTLIRAGHGGETDGRPTFGLATLRDRHVDLDPRRGDIALDFRGKSGRRQRRELTSRTLARALCRLQTLDGNRLLQYVGPTGEVHPLTASDINRYLSERARRSRRDDLSVTAKDFRTWGATVFAAAHLAHDGDPTSTTDAKRRLAMSVKATAAALGHRPATCRNYYIHPGIPEAFERGELTRAMNRRPQPGRPGGRTTLNAEERAVLNLLRT